MAELAARFDPVWGGFGPAPKFPQPSLLELCLCQHRLTGDPGTLAMVTTTLDAMAAGGIYDHLGGGFARYSTDATWTVPHFEKMLYDQAGLVRAYLHAWQVTGSARWLTRSSRRPSPTSCGTWPVARGWAVLGPRTPTPKARRAVLRLDTGRARGRARARAGRAVADFYGVTEAGNFEGATSCVVPGGAAVGATAPRSKRPAPAVRGTRPNGSAPGLDDKVLTEWNAMFGSALAEAAAATGRADWQEAACAVGEFLLEQLREPDTGRWLRSWHGGRRPSPRLRR